MALTAQQICSLARQIAKCPGYTQQSGQLLNAVLDELCQNYDFQIIQDTYNFQFSTSASGNGYAAGSGPNVLPTNFLRTAAREAFYFISGVPYKMVGVKKDEFDSFVQQSGLQSYPQFYYVDMATSPPGLYVWPPASGAYSATIRYYPQQTQITDPETSSEVPWFPNTNYLITRVAGELMKITNDDRVVAFLGDDDTAAPLGAGTILRKYLKMKDDPETAVHTVALDRRRFGPAFNMLPNTKTIGW